VGPVRVRVGGRPRRVPHLMLGVVLVLVGAVGFTAFSLHSAGRVPALAVARDVAAGQTLTSADVRVVTVSVGDGVGLVPGGDLDRVVGRPVAVPRPAGALLSPADLGPSRFPPAGKALAAVLLKPGQYPPGLTTGATVTVLITTAASAAAGGGGGQVQAFAGLVESLAPQPSAAGGTVVVALLMDPDPAKVVASAAAGTVSLVQLAPGSGTP
jgi:SAF domain